MPLRPGPRTREVLPLESTWATWLRNRSRPTGIGGRRASTRTFVLKAHHLANVTSDPLLDLIAAQEARMVAERREPTKRRRYVVRGDVPR